MPIKPLFTKSKLASTPKKSPHYSITIVDKNNSPQKVSDPRALRALLLIMNQYAVIGGAACHWGGPSGVAEIISPLFALMFQKDRWEEHYNFVNDIGHGENIFYAIRANYNYDGLSFEDLKHFRSINSKLTGHGEAHLNPGQVLISNGPLGSGLPQAQGLAIADHVLQKKRLTICLLSDGGAMEGEAKEALSAIPGLTAKNRCNPFLLIISDNNTKLGGRIDEDTYSMAPSFSSLSSLGFETLTIEDGHNLEKNFSLLEKIFHRMENQSIEKPIALIFKTQKGYGLQSTITSTTGGHGHPHGAYDPKLLTDLIELYGNESSVPEEFLTLAKSILASKPDAPQSPVGTMKKMKVQEGVSDALIELTKADYPIFSVSADLQSSTGLKNFHKTFPQNFIDVGIAESNMISTAIGLSKSGLIPIVDTFAQFGITKGNLPLMMAGLSEAPIIGFFSHTGFQDAADGASHQATTYISALGSIPHIDLIHLSTKKEAYELVKKTIEDFSEQRKNGKVPHSTIFFLGRENFPECVNENLIYPMKKAEVITRGRDYLIITMGPMLEQAIKAKDILHKEHGIDGTIINHPYLNIIDMDLITNECQHILKLLHAEMNPKTNSTPPIPLITLEDHQILGGFGSFVSHAIHQSQMERRLKAPLKFLSLGIPGQFGQSAYTAMDLYKKYHLDSSSVAKSIWELIQSQ